MIHIKLGPVTVDIHVSDKSVMHAKALKSILSELVADTKLGFRPSGASIETAAKYSSILLCTKDGVLAMIAVGCFNVKGGLDE